METEFDLRLVLKIVRDYWWKILIAAVALALIFASYATFFINKKYDSQFSLMIINRNNNDYTQSSVVEANSVLGEMHRTISKSDIVLEKICNYMMENFGYTTISKGTVKSSIDVKSDSAGVLTYTVSTTDPQLSYDIAVAAENIIPDVFSGDQFYQFPTKVLNSSAKANSPSSPNVLLYTVIGFVGGAFLAWLFFFIHSIIDTSIITKKDITSRFQYPVIGEIPRW